MSAATYPRCGHDEPQSNWTRFHDMHSGGSQKLEWSRIYIEAPHAEARVVFFKRFGRNPDRVTCTCCGPDYSLSEYRTLAEATAFERGCGYVENSRIPDGRVAGDGYYFEGPGSRFRISYETLTEFLSYSKPPRRSALDVGVVKVIRASEIKPEERIGDVPAEGYVWAGSDA